MNERDLRIFKALKNYGELDTALYSNEYRVIATENTFVGNEIKFRQRVAYFDGGKFHVAKCTRNNDPITRWTRLPQRMVDIIYLKLWPDDMPE